MGKALVRIIIACLCVVFFYNITLNVKDEIKDNAIEMAINDDKYSNAELADFQNLLKGKSFYYYNSLNDNLKEAYISLYYSVKAFDNSCKIKVSEGDLETIVYAIIYDNPEIFWLDGGYFFTDYGDYIEISPEYKYSSYEAEKLSLQLESKVTEILNNMPSYASDYDKELYFNNYICKNTEYDISSLENGGETAYSSLVLGKSICEGYSRAMQLLLNRVGINNYLVTGEAVSNGKTELHMWNVVTIDGYNYHLDTTWNDGAFDDVDGYFYFNVTDEYISRDHMNITPQNNNCTYTYANYFVKNNAYVEYFTGFNNLSGIASQRLAGGENTVEFVFKSSSDYKLAARELENNEEIFTFVENAVRGSGRNLSYQNISYVKIDDYNYVSITFKEG